MKTLCTIFWLILGFCIGFIFAVLADTAEEHQQLSEVDCYAYVEQAGANKTLTEFCGKEFQGSLSGEQLGYCKSLIGENAYTQAFQAGQVKSVLLAPMMGGGKLENFCDMQRDLKNYGDKNLF